MSTHLRGLNALLLDHSSEMLLAVDAATLEIIAANQRVSVLLGYELSALLGQPITDLECALADVFYWEEVRQGGGEVDSVEGLYACEDGSTLPVVKTVRRVECDGHEVLLVRARDERNLRHAEDNLSEAAAQLRATLESIWEGILVTDSDRQFLNMNRRFSAMWEIPASVLVQESTAILAWMSSQLATSGDVLGADVVEEEGSERSDLVELRNGKVFERRSRFQTVHDQVIGRVYSFHDITERIGFEREMARARDAAQSANIAKTRFLGTMSHELRTPMNAIMGYSSLLRDGEPNPQRKSLADKIVNSSLHLLEIINNVIEYARLDAGQVDAHTNETFNLPLLVEETSREAFASARGKGLTATLEIDPAVSVWVTGDRRHLAFILTQLASNASKFTERGGIRIRVSCLDQVKLRFNVEDTGIGIDPEAQKRLFSAFDQLDDRPDRKYEGLGLGLAMACQLVRMMGGEMGVHSQPGKGSRFWLDLSLTVAATPAGRLVATSAVTKQTVPQPTPASEDVVNASSSEHRAKLDATLRLLEKLLASDDTRVGDFYAKAAPHLRQHFGSQIETIGQQINGFEYDRALASLRALMADQPRRSEVTE